MSHSLLPESEPEDGAPLRRLLVVDDDNHAVRILSDFLEARGYSAVPAYDGHEALARFHDDGPFDAIILDVMMPGIDGLEVCRRVKATPSGQLTPVLLLSARSDTRSRVAGLYGGADDYMSKPVDLRELAARVDVLFRTRDRYHELAARRQEDVDAAITDGLTGACNAAYLTRRLEEEIARSDRYSLPLSVLILDLQGLPEPTVDPDDSLDGSIDQTFAGPAHQLLESVGTAVGGALRTHDLYARLRRSRFAVMLPHTSRRSVQAVVDRLQTAVGIIAGDPKNPESSSAGLSFRVGVAELGPRMDATTLLARAEPR
jgi:PleD family two-component response regulator